MLLEGEGEVGGLRRGLAQLRRLVETAGLTNRVDFDLQATSTTDDGTRRPDMVVRLPEGKCIAVDAKVPLAKFLEANEIPVTATGAEAVRRQSLLKEHVKAVRAHIDALASKGYWTDLDSPEFVVAFLPSESLLSAALPARVPLARLSRSSWRSSEGLLSGSRPSRSM